MAHAIFFYASVVFQHQQRFDFQMPQRIEQSGRTTAHAALRAAFNRRLEQFVERNTAGVLCLATANRAAECANATGIDTDTGALRHVFDNRAGSRVNRVQTVITFDQYAGAELTRWCAHAGHNRRRQGNFEG